MSSLTIQDLSHTRDLDAYSMSGVHGGGNTWLAGLGPVANVNVNVDQNIQQYQNVQVNALNNVGVIGAGFGPFKLNVSPSQWASTDVATAL
jgi:hypothetical protein